MGQALRYALALTLTTIVAACGSPPSLAPGPAGGRIPITIITASPDGDSDFEAVRRAAAAYLDTVESTRITADVLRDLLNNDEDSDDPLVLSLQRPDDFFSGRIPGAINMDLAQVAQLDSLAGLPNNRLIVVYCDNGHTGQMASTVIELLGYDASNLEYGLMGWTLDDQVLTASRFGAMSGQEDYPLEKAPHDLAGTYPYPAVNTGAKSDAEAIRLAAARWLQTTKDPKIVSAKDVYASLVDSEADNEPLLVDVRTREQYAQGHLPGAINLPWQELVDLENLAKLPPDRLIVTYSENGHSGAAAAAVLGILGYRASSIEYGVMGWTRDDTVLGVPRFGPDTLQRNFPLEEGETPNAPTALPPNAPDMTPALPNGCAPASPTLTPLEYESKC